MKEIYDSCPANAASRIPAGMKLAVLTPGMLFKLLGEGTAVPMVNVRSAFLMDAVILAAAERSSPIGLGLRLTPGEVSLPRTIQMMEGFFRRACSACRICGYSGPVFFQLELPFYADGGAGSEREVKRLVSEGVSEGFTSFSLRMALDTESIKGLVRSLSDAVQMELGVELRYPASGNRHIAKVIAYLAHFGITPTILRPIGGPPPEGMPPSAAVAADYGFEGLPSGIARVVALDGVLQESAMCAIEPFKRQELADRLSKTGLFDTALDSIDEDGLVNAAEKEIISGAVTMAMAGAIEKIGAAGSTGTGGQER